MEFSFCRKILRGENCDPKSTRGPSFGRLDIMAQKSNRIKFFNRRVHTWWSPAVSASDIA